MSRTERERCMYSLSGGRWCGRPADHTGQHRSFESWARIMAHKRPAAAAPDRGTAS